MSQQPALVSKLNVSLLQLLEQTLSSHRYALRLNEDNPDVLFNTAQVMITIAETVSDAGPGASTASPDIINLLQEALELLNACYSRQEMLLEEQRSKWNEPEEDGGVALGEAAQGISGPGASSTEDDNHNSVEEQSATVQAATTPMDLLDTARASVDALTLLVSLTDPSSLPTLASMAHTLTDVKIPYCFSQLDPSERPDMEKEVAVSRAEFIAALALAECKSGDITVADFLSRLSVFDALDLAADVAAMCTYADLLVESVETMLIFNVRSSVKENLAQLCWTQLTRAQDLYGKVVKLDDEEAKDRKAQIYESRGDVEMLRFRLATAAAGELSPAVKSSAPTLIKNAQTYYRGSSNLFRAGGDEDAAKKADVRGLVAAAVESQAAGTASEQGRAVLSGKEAQVVIMDMMSEGLLGEQWGQA